MPDTEITLRCTAHCGDSRRGDRHAYLAVEVRAPVFLIDQLPLCDRISVTRAPLPEGGRRLAFFSPTKWLNATETRDDGTPAEVDLRHMDFDDYALPPKQLYEECEHTFQWLLEHGVAPEQAAMVLPQSLIRDWTLSGPLDAFARVIRVCGAPDASPQQQRFGRVLSDQIAAAFPENAPPESGPAAESGA